MRRLPIFVAFFLLIPVLAAAHVYLFECSPAEDAVLDEAPSKVTVTFVGSVETAFSKVEVFSPDGEKVSGKTRFLENDTVMEVDLKENLPPGVYNVEWVCMSLDGHRQTGSYKFTIA
ncbi:MAG: copper resistance protein CopC [Nitrospirota bacterium]|jgi:methionine-rich copper-binding protein CopC